MPYCDQKKVIFLHVPKTGGTLIKRLFDIRILDDANPQIRPSPQHLNCALLRDRIGTEKYATYYKFAFVRNPWSRILSSYYWRQTLPKKRPVLPFREFVETVRSMVENRTFYDYEFGDHFIPQIEYTEDVNDVFRFERLEEGIQLVARKLGVEVGRIPPKERKPHDRYWDYYDRDSRTIIAGIYGEEIERFGYVFEEG